MNIRTLTLTALLAIPANAQTPLGTSPNPLADWVKKQNVETQETPTARYYYLPFGGSGLGAESQFIFKDGEKDEYGFVFHSVGQSGTNFLLMLEDNDGDGYPDSRKESGAENSTDAWKALQNATYSRPSLENMTLYNSGWDQLRMRAGIITADDPQFKVKRALLKQKPKITQGGAGIIYDGSINLPGYENSNLSFESRRFEQEAPRAIIQTNERKNGITVHLWRDDGADGTIDAAYSGSGSDEKEAMQNLSVNVVYKKQDSLTQGQKAYSNWLATGTPVPKGDK